MNRYFLFIGGIILFGCNFKAKQNFPIPSKNDINEIIATIITQDSLLNYNKPLSIDLQKIKVNTTELPKGAFIFNIVNIDARALIETKSDKTEFFKKSDTTYFVFQNDTISTFKIKIELVSHFKLTNLAEQNRQWNLRIGKPFLLLSIPIFSSDQRKAYVTINDICGMCGGGKAIYLEKIKGHWKIIKKIQTWVS